MALDPHYIIASDLEQYFVDKDTGLPLAGGTLQFFSDVSRTTPKPVYQLSGAPPNYTYTSMGAVITLSAVGTVQNSGGDNEVIYYYPFDASGNLELYYVVVSDSNGVQQFTREAWPNITSANDPTANNQVIANQIANAQFTQVFLNQGISTTLSVSGATNQEFDIAPDWALIVSGTGSVTVQQIPVSGNQKIVTSPPYVLDVNVSGGITACNLRQRFNTNSGLWSSTAAQAIFLAGAYVAQNQNVGNASLQMYYQASTGGLPVLIVDGVFSNAVFSLVTGATVDQVPSSVDSNEGTAGYIDIYLSFAASSHVQLTSIQVVPTLNPAGASLLTYDLNSSNRELVKTGDYYLPNLIGRPTPSLLVGWDFPVAPFQFGNTGTINTTPAYLCDQTIAAAATSNVNWSIDATSNGLQMIGSGTNDAFYLMQYLSETQARHIVGLPLSVNVFGYVNSISGPVTMRVYLFRAGTMTPIPTLPASIGTIAANGVFTITAPNWRSEYPPDISGLSRGALGTAIATLPYVANPLAIFNADVDTSFDGGWMAAFAPPSVQSKLAIVVTFAYQNPNTSITINSISLTPGPLACRPSPQTADAVLRECQYFYEKSYQFSTPEGTVTTAGQILLSTAVGQSGGNDVLATKSFTVDFRTSKRSNPVVRLYSPASATPNQVMESIIVPGVSTASANVAIAGNWFAGPGQKNATYGALNSAVQVTSAPTSPVSEGRIFYQYAADARMGIV